MSDIIKRSRTDTFEHTINGSLTKRAGLFNQAIRLRDRTAAIKNDIDAIDRVVGTLGYAGDLERECRARRGELKRRGLTYGQLGLSESERNLNNKISRSGFTTAFFLQCLVATGAKDVRLG
jgi:hypothetical protein